MPTDKYGNITGDPYENPDLAAGSGASPGEKIKAAGKAVFVDSALGPGKGLREGTAPARSTYKLKTPGGMGTPQIAGKTTAMGGGGAQAINKAQQQRAASLSKFGFGAQDRTGPDLQRNRYKAATQLAKQSRKQTMGSARDYGYDRNRAVSAYKTSRDALGRTEGAYDTAAAQLARSQGAYGEGQEQLAVLRAAQEGRAPSVAEVQLQEGLEQAQRQALGSALTSRDPNAMRQAAFQQSALARQANRDAAALRAQEIATARAQASGLIGQQQGQALGIGQQAGALGAQAQGIGEQSAGISSQAQGLTQATQAQQQLGQAQQGIDQNRMALEQNWASQQAALEADQRARNDAYAIAMQEAAARERGMGYDVLGTDLDARMTRAQANQDAALEAHRINAAIEQANIQSASASKNTLMGQMGGGLTGAATGVKGWMGGLFSDERSKEKIATLTARAERAEASDRESRGMLSRIASIPGAARAALMGSRAERPEPPRMDKEGYERKMAQAYERKPEQEEYSRAMAKAYEEKERLAGDRPRYDVRVGPVTIDDDPQQSPPPAPDEPTAPFRLPQSPFGRLSTILSDERSKERIAALTARAEHAEKQLVDARDRQRTAYEGYHREREAYDEAARRDEEQARADKLADYWEWKRDRDARLASPQDDRLAEARRRQAAAYEGFHRDADAYAAAAERDREQARADKLADYWESARAAQSYDVAQPGTAPDPAAVNDPKPEPTMYQRMTGRLGSIFSDERSKTLENDKAQLEQENSMLRFTLDKLEPAPEGYRGRKGLQGSMPHLTSRADRLQRRGEMRQAESFARERPDELEQIRAEARARREAPETASAQPDNRTMLGDRPKRNIDTGMLTEDLLSPGDREADIQMLEDYISGRSDSYERGLAPIRESGDPVSYQYSGDVPGTDDGQTRIGQLAQEKAGGVTFNVPGASVTGEDRLAIDSERDQQVQEQGRVAQEAQARHLGPRGTEALAAGTKMTQDLLDRAEREFNPARLYR